MKDNLICKMQSVFFLKKIIMSSHRHYVRRCSNMWRLSLLLGVIISNIGQVRSSQGLIVIYNNFLITFPPYSCPLLTVTPPFPNTSANWPYFFTLFLYHIFYCPPPLQIFELISHSGFPPLKQCLTIMLEASCDKSNLRLCENFFIFTLRFQKKER